MRTNKQPPSSAKLNTNQIAVIEVLRRGTPMTYDRIAEAVGVEPRGIYESALKPLEKAGIVRKTKGGNTIHGRTGALFSIDESAHPKGSFAHENSLFEMTDYRETPADIVHRAIQEAARASDRRRIATNVIDRLCTVHMSGERGPSLAFKIESTSDPARGQGILASEVRNRVYEAICESGDQGITRTDVATATGIVSSSVIPRIRELINQGYAVEDVSATKSSRRVIAKNVDHRRMPRTPGNTYRDERIRLVDTITELFENPLELSQPEDLLGKIDVATREFISRHAVDISNI